MHQSNQTHYNREQMIQHSNCDGEEDIKTKDEENVLQEQEKHQTTCVQKAPQQNDHSRGRSEHTVKRYDVKQER